MLRVSRVRAVAVLAAAAVAVYAAPAGASAPSPELRWVPCPPPPTQYADLPDAKRLECAKLRVPLDYRDPSGPAFDLAVSRLRSTSPAARRGILLSNPGGPGGQGLHLPLAIAASAPRRVVDAYDLIGFDPRGIGRSDPVTCDFTTQQMFRIFPWPLPGGIEENAAVARDLATRCVQRNGERLRHITTANTARDMDRLRAALHERRIAYVGVSYGTYLGAVYASLFPRRTDRFILDSSVDPAKVWRDTFRAWGQSVEIRFPDFARWAAARHAKYGLGSTPEAVREMYFEVAARLDAEPIDSDLGPMDGNLFRTWMRARLYRDAAFPSAAELWRRVLEREAAPAIPAAAALQDAPGWPTVPEDNSLAGFLAVACDDVRWPSSIAQYAQDVRLDSARYPIAGAMAAGIWPCAAWPYEPVEPLVPMRGHGRPSILILQNLRDPATPYAGGVGMRAALRQRARLVTVGEGEHGIYLRRANACAAALTDAFLADGDLPRGDPVCLADDVEAAPQAERLMSAPVRPPLLP